MPLYGCPIRRYLISAFPEHDEPPIDEEAANFRLSCLYKLLQFTAILLFTPLPNALQINYYC
eukprot:scaffold1992_cov187-Amphora_coffeaeformis.AAC.34